MEVLGADKVDVISGSAWLTCMDRQEKGCWWSAMEQEKDNGESGCYERRDKKVKVLVLLGYWGCC